MFQTKIKSYLLVIFFFILLFQCGSNDDVYAMEVSYYSYDTVNKALPKKYRKDEFIYIENKIPYIAFATYKGNNLRFTVKKSKGSNEYLYCVDYSKHIAFDTEYSTKNNLFNNKLRTKLGYAFKYGATKWGDKASSDFTTGNHVLDYYMTQLVTHALIFKYGNNKSNYGIDMSKIVFKDNTGNLAKKTKAFYSYCCKKAVSYNKGNIEAVEFKFKKNTDDLLYCANDYIVSPYIYCSTNSDNAQVKEYKRNISSSAVAAEDIQIVEQTKAYDSPFQVQMPLSALEKLLPGTYNIKVSEKVSFNRKIAGFWWNADDKSSDQEVGKLIPVEQNISDNTTFTLIVGEVILYKRDSITKDIITDAVFELQQYNSSTKKYEYYKTLYYDKDIKGYVTDHIYLSENNKEGKFKLIEKTPGANYINDWDGAEFQLTKDKYVFEFDVENQPILGSLHIKKTGDNCEYKNGKFENTDKIDLSNIKFGLFARKDIYFDNTIYYQKDKKIADLITDENGEVVVNNLLPGDYYIKELETDDLHQIDFSEYDFSISKEDTGKYSTVEYTLNNNLKKCQIKLYKYYPDTNDETKKIPLANAEFGLYAKKDIINAQGKCIVSKDTCIGKGISDKDGKICFKDLLMGEYYVKELKAPKNYILNDGIVDIKIDDFEWDDNQQLYNAYKEIVNQQQQFVIKVKKNGDVLSSYKEESCDYGKYYDYINSPKVLEGIEFALYDCNKQQLQTAKTDKNGVVEFSKVFAGTYYIKECNTPQEYYNTEVQKVVCEADNTSYSSFSPLVVEKTFYNKRCTCSLDISKTGEVAIYQKDSLDYVQKPLSNVVYGIYQDFDYVFPDKELQLKKDTCVGYLITNESGKASFSGYLPLGRYYIKELQTQPLYELDDTKHYFEVQANENQTIQIQVENQNEFINYLLKASVEIYKTDANTDKPLKNVEFTLFTEKGDKIGKYKTNKHGKIFVDNLPYGKYYFIETKCRNGYYSTNNKYYFTLESPKKITLNITNTPILKLGFEDSYKQGLTIAAFLLCLCVCWIIYIRKSVLGITNKRQNKKDDFYE